MWIFLLRKSSFACYRPQMFFVESFINKHYMYCFVWFRWRLTTSREASSVRSDKSSRVNSFHRSELICRDNLPGSLWRMRCFQVGCVRGSDEKCGDSSPSAQNDGVGGGWRSRPDYSSPTLRTARKASCGMSTLPIRFMRFLPSFCLSSSLRFRLMSPP